MGYRVVEVTSHGKLEYSLNYLIYRTVDQTTKIFLDEVETLIVESTSVAITSALLNELIKRKINVIFCDEKHNPASQLIPFYGSHDTSLSIYKQLSWAEETKDTVWKYIVQQKIFWQGVVLDKYRPGEGNFLHSYVSQVQDGDTTNTEGHCAKYYFNRLFGNGFNRKDDKDKRNAYLNYGYALILSQVSRSITNKGYLTPLGIHHKNQFNEFNLACDLMEPFRPIVDDMANKVGDGDFKDQMVRVLQCNVKIRDSYQTLIHAIDIYVASVLKSLSDNNPREILFYTSYEL